MVKNLKTTILISSTSRRGQSLRLVYAPRQEVPQYMMSTVNEADAKRAGSARMQFKDVVEANLG